MSLVDSTIVLQMTRIKIYRCTCRAAKQNTTRKQRSRNVAIVQRVETVSNPCNVNVLATFLMERSSSASSNASNNVSAGERFRSVA